MTSGFFLVLGSLSYMQSKSFCLLYLYLFSLLPLFLSMCPDELVMPELINGWVVCGGWDGRMSERD